MFKILTTIKKKDEFENGSMSVNINDASVHQLTKSIHLRLDYYSI
jgi:hypothetical protein